jgi:hypothetical protein
MQAQLFLLAMYDALVLFYVLCWKYEISRKSIFCKLQQNIFVNVEYKTQPRILYSKLIGINFSKNIVIQIIHTVVTL